MNEETSLWKGSPSQWLNLWPFTGALLLAIAIAVGAAVAFPPAFAALLLPLGYAVWRFLVIKCESFELTSERLRVTTGVINQHIDEVELYRVKDSLMTRPWWMRLTGLTSIYLETSDRSLPSIVIPAIHNGNEVRELLRRQVELQRDKKRVREMDFDDAGESGGADGMVG